MEKKARYLARDLNKEEKIKSEILQIIKETLPDL